MATTSTALKDRLDRDVVERLAARLHAAHPPFDTARFITDATRGLTKLELLQRAEHVAAAMERHLPPDFRVAVDIVTRALGPAHTDDEGYGDGLFDGLPLMRWVAHHGADHFDEAMAFNYLLTQRSTAEFSVRGFIAREPERAVTLFTEWARDPSVHVRRLVSEGTRPSLPWAPKLAVFRDRPEVPLGLLEMLLDDPEDYVRRSVANHLNDLTRTHPSLIVERCAAWLKANAARKDIIAHALRTLRKAGHAGALAVLGGSTDAADAVTVKATLTPKRLTIGETLSVRLTVTRTKAIGRTIPIDLVVHFVKADGSTRPKVFTGKTVTLDATGDVSFARTISFRQHTTRTHYPGTHRIEARVAGRDFLLGSIELHGDK